ncbi:MAG: double-strand break repair protein AddB [Kiloniellales bacterium]|nr:double-strand break repair protein AddB [Kiloniellales bacterium]
MTPGAPAVSSIAAGVSFVDALAAGLLARHGEDPLELADLTLLLPTRRACRAIQDAFLRASGGRPLVLPRCLPLGDLDPEELVLAEADGLGGALDPELPPAIPPLRRDLLLSRLILKLGTTAAGPGGPLNEEQALRLAQELGRFLDQVETEGLGLERLRDLVPEAYAAHWQITLRFLGILEESWPEILAAEGAIGGAERRRRLLEAQAALWEREPPARPVIAAGSTGSIPATAALLARVARLPRGEVVLPGLDREAEPETWAQIREDPAHPQHGLARLLECLGVTRDEVTDWPAAIAPGLEPRRRLADWALRPAPATAAWRDLAAGLSEAERNAALDGVARIDCADPGEEALVIALVLRQALETEGRTAALVTPDRDLARRVGAELRRWEILVDDSAGRPLAETSPGVFLRLLAALAASGLAPVPLLAALKHPLAAGGQAPGAFRARVRELERAVLRGPRPAPGFAGLRRALRSAKDGASLSGFLKDLEARLEPLIKAFGGRRRRLAELVEAQLAAAEALAASDELGGATRLWTGEAGEAAGEFLADLLAAADDGVTLDPGGFPGFFDSLLTGRVVRPRFGRHPRLHIWGPLEARLQHAEVVVLGGLNEGTWPAEVEAGPWLSRPMRRDFGLPAPERRIGLAAQDFVQAFTAPQLYLTRAQRVEGTPTVPSRWLLRLEALLQSFERGEAWRDEASRWRAWAEALDRPTAPVAVKPPAPRPPLAARPRKLSVTRIETWRRDPYALYAAEILRLRALEPLDADPGAAERGILIHEALERFLKAWPNALPEDPESVLRAHGREVFKAIEAKPGAYAFWWPRFCRIARHVAEMEAERRVGLRQALAEIRGSLILDAPGGPFALTAKADRIEAYADGRLAILDYKTGGLPLVRDVKDGYAPQLPLEAAIAAAGGFPGLEAAEASELAYWKLSGGEPAGQIQTVKAAPAELAAAALEGLAALVARFDDPATPYHAVPRPERAPTYTDYAHLARVKEWSAGVLGEGAE